jgi:hypothetical protein
MSPPFLLGEIGLKMALLAHQTQAVRAAEFRRHFFSSQPRCNIHVRADVRGVPDE